MATFDQFELESRMSYSGAYTDDLVVGTMFVSAPVSANGVREAVGSKVLGLNDHFAKRTWLYTDYLNYYSGSYNTGIARHLTLATQDEFVFDSFGPNIVDTYLRDANDPQLVTSSMRGVPEHGIPEYVGPGQRLGAGGFLLQMGSNFWAASSLKNKRWNKAFPFEGRYRSVKRALQSSYFESKTYDITKDEDGTSIAPVATSSNELVSIVFRGGPSDTLRVLDFSLNPTASVGLANGANAAIKRDERTRISIKNRNLIFFGFGDGLTNPTSSVAYSGLEQIPKYRDYVTILSTGSVLDLAIFGPLLRGYKYGLYHANPSPTRCVFRTNHFGQARDMLEQRLYTKFYTSEKNQVLRSPVFILFVSGTLVNSQSLDYIARGVDTTTASIPSYNPRDSGQWDVEYRSGQPFFDIDPID